MNQSDRSEYGDNVIIPPGLAIKAMRDSGYRNTDYALAELIDNSVQANAKNVELICIEGPVQGSQRTRSVINTIAVLDDGMGMSFEELLLALQFGNGTHLEDRQGIGRFGMGLPNSSISQCGRVDVWTWQNGPDNALHSYLDIDEIIEDKLDSVPIPQHHPLPDEWRERSNIIKTSGTLVRWTKLELSRLSWRRAKATFVNTERLVGRMYRKFIHDGRLSIRLLSFNHGQEAAIDQLVKVNDPLYLMKNSTTPAPFEEEPMFVPWGTDVEHKFPISLTKGSTHEIHEVVIRMSFARGETVPEGNIRRGDMPYGKHAGKNIGVSIVRAGRELDLDKSWTIGYDPRERWWGVEVEFPPPLDEYFGVTNNKQSATIFSQMAQYEWDTEAEEGESMEECALRMQEEGDPRGFLLAIAEHIRTQIKQMRERLYAQTKGTQTKNKERHQSDDQPTAMFIARADAGYTIESDSENFKKEHKRPFEEKMINEMHYPPQIAEQIADNTFKYNRKVEFLPKAMEGYSFFNIEPQQGGLTAVLFNTNHPFYRLIETLNFENPLYNDSEVESDNDIDLRYRIDNAMEIIELIFAAWARYELEETSEKQREVISDVRQEWGKMVRWFLKKDGDE